MLQERVNVWLNEHRDPDTNFYPPFPKATTGGSKDIIDPPPELWRPEDEKKKKKGEDKDGKKKKKKAKKGTRMPEPDEDLDAIPMCPNFFGRHVKKAIQAYISTWHDKDDYENYQQKYIPEVLKNTLRPLVFEEVESIKSSREAISTDIEILLKKIQKLPNTCWKSQAKKVTMRFELWPGSQSTRLDCLYHEYSDKLPLNAVRSCCRDAHKNVIMDSIFGI